MKQPSINLVLKGAVSGSPVHALLFQAFLYGPDGFLHHSIARRMTYRGSQMTDLIQPKKFGELT